MHDLTSWLTGWDDWLMVIWFYAFPVALLWASIRWLIDRITK